MTELLRHSIQKGSADSFRSAASVNTLHAPWFCLGNRIEARKDTLMKSLSLPFVSVCPTSATFQPLQRLFAWEFKQQGQIRLSPDKTSRASNEVQTFR
ncbi:hypothetical protein AA0229_1721 [Gluconobacter cerinus NRIC 0229]|nr:hypothetical protein AA0229_1721 [Gluconobacter cerinus NRIC 0229]